MARKSDCVIDCASDVCKGDVILFEEGVFGGSFRKPKHLGDRWILGEIVSDSYGQAKQQHTFSIRLIRCGGEQAEEVRAVAKRNGGVIKRKGRNVYRNGCKRAPWPDEGMDNFGKHFYSLGSRQRQAVLDEKHGRGDSARQARETRKAEQEANQAFWY